MGMPTCRAARPSLVAAKATATWAPRPAPTRLARPGRVLASWTTIGIFRRRAARYIGVHTYPPTPTRTSAPASSRMAPACFTAPAIRPGSRSRSAEGLRGSGTRLMVARSRPAAGTSRASIPPGVPTARSRHSGAGLPEGAGDGQQRADMAGGSAAGKDHGQGRLGVHEGLFTLSYGSWWRALGGVLVAGLCLRGLGPGAVGRRGWTSAAAARAARHRSGRNWRSAAGPNLSIFFGCMPGPSGPGPGTGRRRLRTATSAGPSRRRK